MIGSGLLHYVMELALWMGAMFLLGCPLGALARRLVAVRRRRLSDRS